MDFLKSNFFNTTTQLTIASGTLTASFLLLSDLRRQYITDGFNNDATTASLTISFDATTSIDRLAIMGMNLKAFDIFFNGSTANTFSITSTGSTITSQFSSNSESSMYLRFTPVDVTSVTFDMKSTQVANGEKAVGWIVLSTPHIDFEDTDNRIPSAPNYKPLLTPKDIVHKMSDGGVRIQTVSEKKGATIKFKFITKEFRDELKIVYDLHDNFIFDAFGTMTGWDEFIFETVWPGKFDFFKFSDNSPDSGFSGQINLNETSL